MTTQQPSSEPTMHVDRYERGWMIAAVIMLVSFAVAVTVAGLALGIQLPAPEARVNPQTVAVQGPFAAPGLRELAAKHPSVGEVRGLGVFWAIELVTDQQTREPLAPYGGSSPGMAATLAACKSGGLLPFSNYNRIHACPPCNVSDTEIADGLQILDAALTVADGYAS